MKKIVEITISIEIEETEDHGLADWLALISEVFGDDSGLLPYNPNLLVQTVRTLPER